MSEIPQLPDLSAARRIGEHMRQRRQALDLPKATAAERAGVSRRTWTELEAGVRASPTKPILDRIDAVLRDPIGTLYAMTGAAQRADVERLRREAVELLERLNVVGLQAVIEVASARRDDDLRDEVAALRAQHEQLSRAYEQLAATVAAPAGGSAHDDDGRPQRGARPPRRRAAAAAGERRATH